MIKNVLITGGSGFVGQFISKKLSTIYNVLTPTRQELDLLNKINVDNWFNNNQIDAIIHCALTGREELFSDNPIFLSDSLLMFRNLWNKKDHYKMFINLGTAYEFDLSKNNFLVKEDDFIQHLPVPSYGYAKNVIARIIKDTDNFYNLRLFGVCHETESNLRFFKKVIFDKEVIIKNDQYLDYIYLEDLIPMINCILEGNAEFNIINMVYNTKYLLSELAYILCDSLNIDKNKIKIANSNGINLTGNSDRLTGYNFKLVGIEQGLKNYSKILEKRV